MLLLGGLGFPSFALVFLLIIILVIRDKWRNAVARKEEITRLVVMASEEAEIAELEASVVYSSLPVARRYQCPVCYCPTTTRCSQCKAVRYCSGKCQIIHWRQGHKDECCPLITTGHFDEESDFVSNDFDIKNKISFSFEAPLAMDIDDEVKAYSDVKRTLAGSATMSTSSPCFSSSTARSETSVGASISEVLGSSTGERSEEDPSDVIASNMCRTTINANNAELRTSPPSESIAYSVNSMSCASELKKMKSSNSDEKVHHRLKIPRTKTVMCDDVQSMSLGNKKTTDGAALTDKLVMDAAKLRSSPSICSRSYSMANDRRNESQPFDHNEVRSMSFSGSCDNRSSSTGRHSVPTLKSAKTGSAHASPSKIEKIPSLSQNASEGLKTSVWKVAEHFRASKQSKPYMMGVGRDIAGKYNYKTLFPYKLFIQLYLCDEVELCPFGLINCGNSCYANAVLQCLAFTRPLTSYLLQGLHSKACQKRDWCFICEFECLILKASEGNYPLSPIGILSQIQRIGSHLIHGREEDAHEFLRYAVDTMQSTCLEEAGVVGSFAEESTLVGLTFGGYLRSKIKCLKCSGISERYERIMDLTVEIDGDIGTLEEALAQFTASEMLDGENKYKCSRCKSYEKATKKLTVLEAPNILTIVLKRFQSGNLGKLNKSVQFPQLLNLAPYMSGTGDRSPMYSLYAVVVHLDMMSAAFSGHYVCYVKNFQGEWFRVDDSMVIHVDLESVLLERSYMLLYARRTPRAPSLVRTTGVSPDGKIKRDSEAVPSSYSEKRRNSKARPNSMISSMDSSMSYQKLRGFPYWMTPDGSSNNQLLDPEDWRFHSIQRNPVVDSSSDSSSIFSCSDAGSYSTESTKDSASAEDISGYIFGVGPSWYSP